MAITPPRAIGAMDDRGGNWTKESRKWIPAIDKNHQFRIAKLKQELNLEERGRADGRLDKPSRNDRTLNEPQLEVCNRVFSGILLLNQFLAEQLGQALNAVRQRAPGRIDLDDYKARIALAADTAFVEHRADVQSTRAADLEAQKNLRYFVSRNRLRAAAHYSESAVLPVSIIFGMFVLESLLNGMLFRDVVAGGLGQGAVVAAGVSAINIALGIAAGLYGWRNLGHVSHLRKGLGVVITLICHALAIGWNLIVAHFREVAEIASRDPKYDFDLSILADQTRDHIATHGWLGVGSIIAWALLGLGLLIHFVSAKEGWDDLADRYPDYRKMDKRAKGARADFEETLLDMRRSARESANEIIAAAEDECAAAVQKLHFISEIENVAAQREKEVRDSEDEWVNGGTQLLKLYRDVNVIVRGDSEQPPAYFTTYPTPSDYRQRRFGNLSADSAIDAHVEATRAALSTIATLRAAAEEQVEAGAADIRVLRAELNRALAGLDTRVEASRDAATREAEAKLKDDDAWLREGEGHSDRSSTATAGA